MITKVEAILIMVSSDLLRLKACVGISCGRELETWTYRQRYIIMKRI